MPAALFFRLVRQEFADRYAGSVLGVVWSVVHPLLLVTVFFAVFSQLMGARLPGVDDAFGYGIYLVAGILPWLAFSGAVRRITEVLHQRRDVLRKIALPLWLLPLCVVTAETLTFVIGFAVFALGLVVVGYDVALGAVWVLPMIYVAHQLLALGVGLVLGALNVFLKDIQEFVAAMLMVWFWATPIVWVPDIAPAWVLELQQAFNPAYWLVHGYQAVLAMGQPPDPGVLLRLMVVSPLVLVAAWWLLRAGERRVRDHL